MNKNWKEHSLFIILFGDSIIPKCVPFHYRIYLIWSKLYRSVKCRLLSNFKNRELILNDKIEEPDRKLSVGEGRTPFINKTFSNIDKDLDTPDVNHIVQKIKELKQILTTRNLRFTTTAGSFKSKDFIPEKERHKLWENSWIIAHSKVKERDVVLDIGGASTIFSYLLAYMGCEAYVIDNDWGNHGIIYNARYTAAKMGWRMNVYNRSISKKLPFKDGFFDNVFCICVLEHLTSLLRKWIMLEMNRVLKSGGIAGLTFDYDEGRNTPGLDKGIRYSLKKTLIDDIIRPSGLEIYGNKNFIDDCPSQFFLGSLFLTKPKK